MSLYSPADETSGPFDLIVCPGAWCQPAQWNGFLQGLRNAPTDLGQVAVAEWPRDDGAAGLVAHREAVLEAVPSGHSPLVLAAHSFGAFPMLEAAATLGDRVVGVILIDAFLPSLGRSTFSQSEGSRGPAAMRASALQGLVPAPDPSRWGLTGALADLATAQLQPHAQQAFEDDLSDAATQALDTVAFKAFLGASRHTNSPFMKAFASLEGRADWFSVQIEGGHMLQLERPSALAYWTTQFLRMVAGKGF